MPPRLPRTMSARQEMWEYPSGEDLADQDPMEPTDHLDEKSKGVLNLFKGASAFMTSRFGIARTDDQHWFPVRPLGQGGFGAVAVWERRDSTGNVIEETAVKQTRSRSSMGFEKDGLKAKEAAIMHQLNEKKSDNIVFLKRFKTFRHPETKALTWRFYFEYCPYGDLGRLLERYRAWGTYLPEEFLWWVMHSLALVAKIMEDGDYTNLSTGRKPEVPYTLIHSDIKPPNVFLGYNTDSASPWHGYPVIKLGDWGLADFTYDSEGTNPAKFVQQGTQWYIPPEARPAKVVARYESWKHPPFYRDSPVTGGFTGSGFQTGDSARKIGSPHNICAIGIAMHELMVHSHPAKLSNLFDWVTEDQYIKWEGNTVPMIRTMRTPEYSYDLRGLMRKCLNLNPGLRPTADEILEKTTQKLRGFENTAVESNSRGHAAQQAAPGYQIPKLYHKENEINDMPIGTHVGHFDLNEGRLAWFVHEENKYAAPLWGPLRHPYASFFKVQYERLREEEQQRELRRNAKAQKFAERGQRDPRDRSAAKRKAMSDGSQGPLGNLDSIAGALAKHDAPSIDRRWQQPGPNKRRRPQSGL